MCEFFSDKHQETWTTETPPAQASGNTVNGPVHHCLDCHTIDKTEQIGRRILTTRKNSGGGID